jgi:hypothetical protein
MSIEASFQRVQARHDVPQIAIPVNEFLDPGLLQQFILVARDNLFVSAGKLEAVKKNPPFTADVLRVGFPSQILRIYKVLMIAQGVVHGRKNSSMGAALEKSWKTEAWFPLLIVEIAQTNR